MLRPDFETLPEKCMTGTGKEASEIDIDDCHDSNNDDVISNIPKSL